MRRIHLKAVTFTNPIDGTEVKFDYAEQLKMILGQAPAGAQGINLHDMRRRLKIMDAVDAMPSSWTDLEDADWLFLRDLVGAWRWGVAVSEIAEFAASVIDAPAVPATTALRAT